jgi:hypothetical protein
VASAYGNTTLTVTFTFSEAVTPSNISVTGNLAGTSDSSNTTPVVITVENAPASGPVVISFTATASEGRTTEVSEAVTWGDETTTTSDVEVSTTASTTSANLSIASATKTGNTHLITLTGKSVPLTIPSALAGDYAGAVDVTVITFNGILNAQEASRIQQTSPGLEQYVTGPLNGGGTNYSTATKTQAEIETQFASAPGQYFWKTENPVTYNKIKNYTASADTDFSVLLAPTSPLTDQIVTLTKKVGDDPDSVVTTYIIDYTAVTFDVKDTVKVSTNNTTGPVWAWTTSGLSVTSAIQEGLDVYLTLAGTNVPKTIDPTFLTANYPGVTGCAIISLDGIFIAGETFRYQGVNPALDQYVTGGLSGGGTNYGATAKTQTEVETAFSSSSTGPYFWQTAAPVTYNKMVQVTGGTDTVLSIMLKPTSSPSDQKVTIIKKLGSAGRYTKTITYHLDYTGVTFAQ